MLHLALLLHHLGCFLSFCEDGASVLALFILKTSIIYQQMTPFNPNTVIWHKKILIEVYVHP